MSRRLIFELNEFNVDLLESSTNGRPFLAKVLDSYRIDTNIPDSYESDFLEPWSQWVSVHTGTATKDHKIKHLGDADNLKYPQGYILELVLSFSLVILQESKVYK